MKKILILILVLFSQIYITNQANAGNCKQTVYNICIRQERNNSDASRGGMSKEEFCRIVAEAECMIVES